MKPRGFDESDASYIKRLEASNRDLRAGNLSIEHYNERARPAASFTASVLKAVAGAADMQDDPRVIGMLDALEALAELPWSKELPKAPYVFGLPAIGDRGNDAEMVVRSVYESALSNLDGFSLFCLTEGMKQEKREFLNSLILALWDLAQANLEGQARAAISRPERTFVLPERIENLEGAQAALDAIGWEIYEAVGDLEASRSMLRMDLRAAMYESVFRSIRGIGFKAEELSRQLLVSKGEDRLMPF